MVNDQTITNNSQHRRSKVSYISLLAAIIQGHSKSYFDWHKTWHQTSKSQFVPMTAIPTTMKTFTIFLLMGSFKLKYVLVLLCASSKNHKNLTHLTVDTYISVITLSIAAKYVLRNTFSLRLKAMRRYQKSTKTLMITQPAKFQTKIVPRFQDLKR